MTDTIPQQLPTVALVAPTPVKPGWLTSEHLLTVIATLLTAFYATGLIPTTGTVAAVVAMAATMLGALGYTVSRTMLKAGAS